MACRIQSTKCHLERKGVRIAKRLLGIKHREIYDAPFDLVNKQFGYEIKALSVNQKDFKIHISKSSMDNKLKLAEIKQIQPILVAIVIDTNSFKAYQSQLRSHIRINQMERII